MDIILDNDWAGEIVDYYRNGEIESKTYYSDGEKVGKYYEYDAKGVLSNTQTLDKGYLVAYTEYDTTGKLINYRGDAPWQC